MRMTGHPAQQRPEPKLDGERLGARHGELASRGRFQVVRCELVSEMPNSLLAGNIQGISPIRGLAVPGNSEKGHEISFLWTNSLRILTGNFLRPCRELNRAIREVSAVIRESAFVRYLAFLLMTNPIARSRGSPISSSTPAFVRVKGAPGMRKSLAELVDANDRRS